MRDWPTVADVSRQLRVSPEAVRRMCQDGRLRSEICTEGTMHRRIDPESLRAFIETHELRVGEYGKKWIRKRD